MFYFKWTTCGSWALEACWILEKNKLGPTLKVHWQSDHLTDLEECCDSGVTQVVLHTLPSHYALQMINGVVLSVHWPYFTSCKIFIEIKSLTGPGARPHKCNLDRCHQPFSPQIWGGGDVEELMLKGLSSPKSPNMVALKVPLLHFPPFQAAYAC